MERHKFILWPEKQQIRDNCIQTIRDLDPEVAFDVVIRKHVNSKTASQRSWFHVLCEMLGDELGMRKGDVKEIAKAKLFGWRHIDYGGVTLTMADGHSEALGLEQYSRLIEILYELGGEAGIVLPAADPYRRQG